MSETGRSVPTVFTGVMSTQEVLPTSPIAPLRPPETGLSSREAQRRMTEFGPNDPARARRSVGIVELLRFFANPLVIILLIAAMISALVGERLNAGIIATIVLLSVALDFLQT